MKKILTEIKITKKEGNMHYLNIELDGIDKNGEEKKFKLSELKGKNLIVYFYPQDDTPVCTKEAQEFRDAIDKIQEFAQIIGVSNNNINDHLDFQKKYELKFILLSDPNNKLKKAFEEYDIHLQNLHRATFIINKEGKIIKYWNKVDVEEHIDDILNFFKNKD